MVLIRAGQLVSQPWRNGGGRTREMLARPAGTDWKLRVSLADIEEDGPFSSFPGVERWFAVVQGAGVLLRFSSGERPVCVGDAPLCFDGATAPGCSLVDGPTQDLNLMVRDGIGAMRQVQANQLWRECFDERGLFTVSAGQWHEEPKDSGSNSRQDPGRRLEAYTLAWNLGGNPCRFVPDDPSACSWWLGYSGNTA